jgi:hypothetical protein
MRGMDSSILNARKVLRCVNKKRKCTLKNEGMNCFLRQQFHILEVFRRKQFAPARDMCG